VLGGGQVSFFGLSIYIYVYGEIRGVAHHPTPSAI